MDETSPERAVCLETGLICFQSISWGTLISATPFLGHFTMNPNLIMDPEETVKPGFKQCQPASEKTITGNSLFSPFQ